jgi:RimJ/RimL family protein N-acetyltransferase
LTEPPFSAPPPPASPAAAPAPGTAALPAVIAIAAPENVASRRVMQKIGMRYAGQARYFGLDVVRYERVRP